MNKNEQLARKHGAKILPFKKLPKEARYALIQYMVVDGEAWDVSTELAKAFEEGHKIMSKCKYEDVRALHKEAIKKSLKFYTDKYGDCKFGYAHIPTRVMTEEVYNRNADINNDFDSFEEYRVWYFKSDDMPNHPRTKRWPSILSGFDDEVLEDGWHRFHSYVAMKCRTIPCIFYLNKENYRRDI